jgi:hypothetical protein
MSELEQDFMRRAEAILDGLEKAKKAADDARSWFLKSAAAFFIASISLIGAIAATTAKVNQHADMFKNAASRDGVSQLVNIHQKEMEAISNLIDNPDHKAAVREFQEIVDGVNANIFLYSLGVSRGVKTRQ